MNKTIPIIFLSISLICVGAAWYLWAHQSPEGEKRQATEESIAEQYLADIQTGAAAETETAVDESTVSDETEPQETEDDVTDELYYTRDGVTYTPDYAKGYMACVLEIPSIGLKRGVYCGTWEEIDYDLDIWMTVASRPDYELGKTHFCIYGHNHPEQDLSFNRLKDVQPGDYFILTTDTEVYLYQVTEFFAEWREIVARDYVDNFDLSAENCYIFTCGRNEYRYRDICVVGKIYGTYSVHDWNVNGAKYTAELQGTPLPEAETEEAGNSAAEEKKSTELQVTQNGNSLLIRLTDENGDPVREAGIGVFDSDGLLLSTAEGDELSWTQGEGSCEIKMEDLPADDGTIVIGVISLPDSSYKMPADTEVKYSVKTEKITVETVNDTDSTTALDTVLKFAIPALLAVNLIGLLVLIISALRDRTRSGKILRNRN